jgi:hypothetical protein
MSEIQIINFDPNTGIATVGMTTAPKKLSGMEKLAHIVALEYLKNPGRDVIDPYEGSGLRAAIGQYNYTQEDEVRLLATQRTQAIEKEIIARQPAGIGTPDDRLKKLSILDIAMDLEQSRLMLRVQIINEAGDSTDILI